MACEKGQEELACSACDLCNQQAPSHFKHAIPPQTRACFSTTHGFNWSLPPLLLPLLLRLQQPGVAQQTRLWNQKLANPPKNPASVVTQSWRFLSFPDSIFVYMINLFLSYTYFYSHVMHLYKRAFFWNPAAEPTRQAVYYLVARKKKICLCWVCIKGSFIWLLAKMVLNVCCLWLPWFRRKFSAVDERPG